MAKTAKKRNPGLWKRIVARVKAGSKGGRSGQWSARKAQLATARYKKAGGGLGKEVIKQQAKQVEQAKVAYLRWQAI